MVSDIKLFVFSLSFFFCNGPARSNPSGDRSDGGLVVAHRPANRQSNRLALASNKGISANQNQTGALNKS